MRTCADIGLTCDRCPYYGFECFPPIDAKSVCGSAQVVFAATVRLDPDATTKQDDQ